MPSNHLILFHLLLLPSIFPIIRVISNESAPHIRWPKYWSFSFSISSSDVYQSWFHLGLTGLILLPKGLWRVFTTLQFQSINSLVLSLHDSPILICVHHYWKSDNFDSDLVDKVMFLLFNTLSRFIIAFLSRSKSLNFVASVTIHNDFGGQENKICHCFHFLFICYEMLGPECPILTFLNVEF